MKKNIITYILILIVIIVWGIVFYNLFNPTDKNREVQAPSSVQTRKKERRKTELSLNYRNPFKAVRLETKSNAAGEKRKEEIKKEPPAFRYKGLIKGAANKVIIIENNGVSEVIHRNDSLLGYKIISINKDSVVLRKKGIRYSLTKN